MYTSRPHTLSESLISACQPFIHFYLRAPSSSALTLPRTYPTLIFVCQVRHIPPSSSIENLSNAALGNELVPAQLFITSRRVNAMIFVSSPTRTIPCRADFGFAAWPSPFYFISPASNISHCNTINRNQ
ncbi:hypothetical protein SERLADRAFT_474855 [Serpula lacrymans var. lacrymans S7.9]|uniref:Uncharacterized protein n=1 Tax=Serpula lacrymans var. lacrymans (strain S7.9) TaxID=578457 RepID=F8P5H8_SERL9|nr:uncharacterized protein SERLADRAFT_474855 [Serpula lacrymans var. lacrymans S7.9]EGO21865.1 hypothetical protein SERLADRAFT_474855 [Serpula lacrymans var. lacrymans S7.9]